jgi:hypothetical protein
MLTDPFTDERARSRNGAVQRSVPVDHVSREVDPFERVAHLVSHDGEQILISCGAARLVHLDGLSRTEERPGVRDLSSAS